MDGLTWSESPPLHAKVTPLQCHLDSPTWRNARFRSQEEPGPISPVILCFPVLVGSFVYSSVSFSLCIRELELLVLISVGRNLEPHFYISVLVAKIKLTHIPRSWEKPDALLSLFESTLMPVQVGSGVYTHITLASKDASRGHGYGAFFERSDVWEGDPVSSAWLNLAQLYIISQPTDC